MWGARERALVEKLEPVAAAKGLTIIEMELPHRAGDILRIYVDRRDGTAVTVDDCAAFSPIVSAFLDTQEGFDFRYHLEVSSPGLDRPVRRWEELPRFVGKRIQVVFSEKIAGRRKATGTLESVDEANGSFTMHADEGGPDAPDERTVTVRRGQVKRINLIWEGER